MAQTESSRTYVPCYNRRPKGEIRAEASNWAKEAVKLHLVTRSEYSGQGVARGGRGGDREGIEKRLGRGRERSGVRKCVLAVVR